MGKNPNEETPTGSDGSKMKKILHGEMIDRGILLDKKKKSSKRRPEDQDARRHRSKSKSGGAKSQREREGGRDRDRNRSSRGRSSRSRQRKGEKSVVVTFSSRHESRTFTEIDEKTRSSIDSCSSGVQSGSNNSDLDSLNSNQNSPKDMRSKKLHLKGNPPSSKPSSDSDVENGEKFKETLRMKAVQRKQRAAEAKVDEQETKLVEFAQRLSQRKSKLEELHGRLKQRKQTLKEREEKLKIFESQIIEREEKMKAKEKIVRHKEAKLRHEEGSVKLREESVTERLTQLERRTQLIELKEDLSNEITDLTRKQLYQSSWNLGGTLKHKKDKHKQSTDSLDDLSDDQSDDLIDNLSNMKIARSNKIGLVM